MSDQGEEWKNFPGSPDIFVSNMGRRKNSSGRLYTNNTRPGSGYCAWVISRQVILAHRAVAQIFVVNPDPDTKIYVNHINGVRNDNRSINLEWVTPQENSIKAINVPNTMIRCRPVLQYTLGGEYMKEWNTIKDIAKEFKLTDPTSICAVCNGRRNTAYGYIWKYKENEDLPGEEWRYCPKLNFIGVSNMGRIEYKSERRTYGNELNSYLKVTIQYETWLVHRLVSWAFLGIPESPDMVVDHINSDRHDNRAVNLEWVTTTENNRRGSLNRTTPGNQRSVDQLTKTGEYIKSFDNVSIAARELEKSNSLSNIHQVCLGNRATAMGYKWRYTDTI